MVYVLLANRIFASPAPESETPEKPAKLSKWTDSTLGFSGSSLRSTRTLAGAALMFAVNNQSTWLQETACEVRVLFSTVIRAVFCVTLLSVKHPEQTAANNAALTAAVISRRLTGHLQRAQFCLARFFYQPARVLGSKRARTSSPARSGP